ncbi:DNA topoisomerase 3 [Alicyclobacillus acidoterrestris]|uniref:type IA DNA topoisomerase n=1 Tax=Alicyclobacillus acidoterrestris TaxID=1450 RepID=UPI003F52AE11
MKLTTTKLATTKLMIAEKPSVARDIAGVIGGVKRHDGYLETNTHIITWALGHLVTLADAHDYDAKYKTWRMEDLPIVPRPFRLKVIEKTKAQYQIVASLLKRAEEVVVATDAGREGQLIYELIALSAGYKGPTKRLWLSSMTPTAIRDALKQLKDNRVYQHLFFAGFARAQADWLTGINATRAMTTQAGTLLPIGRVQTPTLAMIVQRDSAIKQFTPQPFFELQAQFVHANGSYKGTWMNRKRETRIDQREAAHRLLEKLCGQSGTIHDVEEKIVHEQPPQLFDLTSLQRTANQKYGFTAERTLQLAQSLYEKHKVLTYPRTDSRYLSDDIVPTLRRRLLAASTQFPYLRALLPAQIRTAKRVVNATKVTDHHAILPTEQPVSSALRPDEQKIYELVSKQTLAALLEPAEWATTTIVTAIMDELFKTNGRVLVKPGWKAVFPAHHDTRATAPTDEPETEPTLPAVTNGDSVQVAGIHVAEKETKPPAHFTEASLLSAMEKAGREVNDEILAEALKARGLGTPATRAAVLEKLKRDGYIQVVKKQLIATEKGKSLIGSIRVDALKSPELTGDWEHRLAQIEAGHYDVRQFIHEITEFTHSVVESIGQFTVHVVPDAQTASASLGQCPLCGGQVVETKKSFACANWKSHGCAFCVWKQISGHNMSAAQVKDLLHKKRTRPLKFKSKAGKPFQARILLNPDGTTTFEFLNETDCSATRSKRPSAKSVPRR